MFYYEDLTDACFEGDLERVKRVIEQTDFDKSAYYDDGSFEMDDAVSYACSEGHTDIVRYFTTLKDDKKIHLSLLREKGFTGACGNGHVEMVKLLVDLSDEYCINIHAEY